MGACLSGKLWKKLVWSTFWKVAGVFCDSQSAVLERACVRRAGPRFGSDAFSVVLGQWAEQRSACVITGGSQPGLINQFDIE